MKKQLLLLLGAGSFSLLLPSAKAVPVFADNFNSYTTGTALVGQGPWLQTSTVATTPILVSGASAAAVGSSGQDVYAAFSTPINNATGNSLFLGATITVSAAQTTGDYFIHLETVSVRPPGFLTKFSPNPPPAAFYLVLRKIPPLAPTAPGCYSWAPPIVSCSKRIMLRGTKTTPSNFS
jgi:hypothetical protein